MTDLFGEKKSNPIESGGEIIREAVGQRVETVNATHAKIPPGIDHRVVARPLTHIITVPSHFRKSAKADPLDSVGARQPPSSSWQFRCASELDPEKCLRRLNTFVRGIAAGIAGVNNSDVLKVIKLIPPQRQTLPFDWLVNIS